MLYFLQKKKTLYLPHMTNISGRERPIASSLLSYIKAIDCLLAAVNLKGSSQAEGSSNSEMVCVCG